MFRLVVLLVLLTFIDLNVESVSETIHCVDKPCSCCRNGTCTESRQTKNLCEGCIAGYTGLTCIEPCPANCINCSQLFLESERTCYQCKNGFYNGHYKDLPNQPLQQDCALPCKTDCKICSSYHNCTQCENGMYLAGDKTCKSCPENCKQCLSSSDCNLCEDRYYWTGTFCKLCGPYCKHCQSESECTVCYRGFFLSGGRCIQCDPGCISCNEHAECTACQEGYLLLEHKCIPCSKTHRCENNICNDKNGVCTYGCVKGYWGSRCDHVCSSNCVDSECERNIGTCTKGCIAIYNGSECDCPTNCVCDKQGCVSCIQGFGETCEKPCGEGCPESKCNRTTGECFTNCLQGFSGKKCNKDETQQHDMSVVLIVSLISVGAFVLAVLVFLGYRICICKRQQKEQYKADPKNAARCPSDEEKLIDIPAGDSTKNDTAVTETTRINIDRLAEEYRARDISKEFKDIPVGDSTKNDTAVTETTRINIDRLAEEYRARDISKEFKQLQSIREKKEIVIKKVDDAPDSINAVYNDGFTKEKEYIVSLEPKFQDTTDIAQLWDMIWNKNCGIIVVLTSGPRSSGCLRSTNCSTSKNVNVKCFDSMISIGKKIDKKDFTLTLSKAKKDVRLLEFYAWSDVENSQGSSKQIAFWEAFKATVSTQDGPTLVQCRGDIGNTGLFVAFDILAREASLKGHVDIYNCVKRLRQQCPAMCQTEEQYRALYEVLIVYSQTKQSSSSDGSDD